MHYSRDCSQLLSVPEELSPFNVAQQKESRADGLAVSAEQFISELLRIRISRVRTYISVPYLNAFIEYSGFEPTMEAATDFAQTPAAKTTVNKTFIALYAERSSFYGNSLESPDASPSCTPGANHTNRFILQPFTTQVFIEQLATSQGERALGRRFSDPQPDPYLEWQFPSSFPLESNDIDSPKSSF